MDEVQVDIVNTELLETLIAGLSRLLVVYTGPFCGYPQLLAGESGGFDSLSYFFFVMVDYISVL
jgi:hypothetical protein